MVAGSIVSLALACNIIQVAQLGCKAGFTAYKLWSARTGEHPDLQVLRDVESSLTQLNTNLQGSLQPSTMHSHAGVGLLDASTKCLDLASEYIRLLDGFKLEKPHSVWETFQKTTKVLWDPSMETMDAVMQTAWYNLLLALLIYMNSTLATSADQQRILDTCEPIEKNFLNAVKTCIAPIQDDLARLDQQQSSDNGLGQSHPLSDFATVNREQLDKLEKTLNDIANCLVPQDLYQTNSVNVAEQKIMASLRFFEIGLRAEQIGQAKDGTFRWILQPQNLESDKWDGLVTWLSSSTETQKIFWVSGKPGSGKSTLMRFLKENLQRQDHMLPWADNCTVFSACYYFWGAGNQLEKSTTGLLRSLLLQILKQKPDLMPRNLRVLLFVDGLDELEGPDEMRQELIRIHTRLNFPGTVKICVSSRPWNIFRDSFRQYPKVRLQELTREDICTYVQSELLNAQLFRNLLRVDEVSAKQIVSKITDNAEGVFLWSRLVVRDLLTGLRNGDSLDTLHQKLNDVPSGMNKLFKHMMESIDPQYRPEAYAILQIALLDKEQFPQQAPLCLLDLLVIDEKRPDAILTNPTQLAEMFICDTKRLRLLLKSTLRRVNSRCMGLLELLEYLDRNGRSMMDSDQLDLDHVLRPKFTHKWRWHMAYTCLGIQAIKRVLRSNASPNEMYRGASVWALFLSFLAQWLPARGTITARIKQNYLTALRLLIEKDADLVLPKSWLANGELALNYLYRVERSANLMLERPCIWPEDLPVV
ncbi:hypothetical protein BO94DRAFT_582797 [Aspergillus sclerotioniger CBS 115572]|uniref:NACHT domain-containing protein n=1 Tax=Aspergillus sclerotioniger CBS 115572 TaxID=1450535 RepID=A0A317X4A9_9EURO|nr:hypothetical protein BO94DRAFT_582797 [Aspergillus sclerotioniger CBS 115572]PWY93413.1 hypothetical protein BO94DRAFT_582797 [Aspergillus sclerotioniger CBS 115572]